MKSKYLDGKKDLTLNDVDWTNFYYDFVEIFRDVRHAKIISSTEVWVPDPNDLNPKESKKPTFVLDGYVVKVMKDNLYGFPVGAPLSKFMLLAKVRFKDNPYATLNHISYYMRKKEIPYIRVGVDYFKIIKKENRYGVITTILKQWKKEEIKDDLGKETLKLVNKWDDFTIVPSNLDYKPTHNNCYNLYCEFPHVPFKGKVKEKDIPHTMGLVRHIFGKQLDIGLKYLKLLYENPEQILPVLVLVSEERETGKTTFLNWMHIMFGENSVLISPQELTSQFNSGYAAKNIIMIDETVLEKSTSVEKLKSIATAKSISVSQKYVSNYSIPFFGKIIICTNKEKDFMRVDDKEIRFWVRSVDIIKGKKNTEIEKDLFREIPKFLTYLSQLPDVDRSHSRMVFTMDEIQTTELTDVKEESKSGLRKEIEINLENFFLSNPEIDEFEATIKDIKQKWFPRDNNIGMAYIRKVIRDEMKMTSLHVKKYYPFKNADPGSLETGKPFLFKNPYFGLQIDENGTEKTAIVKKEIDDELPF